MNREIKFRAWNGNEMVQLDGLDFLPGGLQGRVHGDPDRVLSGGGISYMQFIGIHDKNGKEIYEGDIVRSKPPARIYLRCKAAVVRYDAMNMCFEAHEREGDDGSVLFPGGWDGEEIVRYWEVIGNIYENAELLKP